MGSCIETVMKNSTICSSLGLRLETHFTEEDLLRLIFYKPSYGLKLICADDPISVIGEMRSFLSWLPKDETPESGWAAELSILNMILRMDLVTVVICSLVLVLPGLTILFLFKNKKARSRCVAALARVLRESTLAIVQEIQQEYQSSSNCSIC